LIGCDKNALMDFENTLRDQFGASLERAVARRAWLGKHWGTPAASDDRIQRRGWATFTEYFAYGSDLPVANSGVRDREVAPTNLPLV